MNTARRGARAFAVSTLWAVILFSGAACRAVEREILVEVRLDVAETDGYRLNVWRRAPFAGARWVRSYTTLFLRPRTDDAGAGDAGADAAYVLPALPGRHLIRREGGPESGDVLVEALAVRVAAGGDEQAVGPPAVGQFSEWPTRRSVMRLDLTDQCGEVDVLAVGPYRTCEPGPATCGTVVSACGTFRDGSFARGPCADDPSPEPAPDAATGDAAPSPVQSCPFDRDAVFGDAGRPDAPMDATSDSGADAAPPNAGYPPGTLRFDCGGQETCGRDGRWSRCIVPTRCLTGPLDARQWLARDRTRRVGESCCWRAGVGSDVRCDYPVATSCSSGLSCFAGTCDSCGLRNDLCCGDSCAPGEGECTMPERVCRCGAVGQRCCRVSDCDTGGVCRNRRCVSCGAGGQPCCLGDVCGGGLICRSGACEPCGANGQPCCNGGACGASLVCNAGACAPCGGNSELCCAGGGCASGRMCLGGRCRTCAPGAVGSGPCDPCENYVCQSNYEWACQLRGGAACRYEAGTHFRCCTPSGGGSGWQFCLSSCVWAGCASHACP